LPARTQVSLLQKTVEPELPGQLWLAGFEMKRLLRGLERMARGLRATLGDLWLQHVRHTSSPADTQPPKPTASRVSAQSLKVTIKYLCPACWHYCACRTSPTSRGFCPWFPALHSAFMRPRGTRVATVDSRVNANFTVLNRTASRASDRQSHSGRGRFWIPCRVVSGHSEQCSSR